MLSLQGYGSLSGAAAAGSEPQRFRGRRASAPVVTATPMVIDFGRLLLSESATKTTHRRRRTQQGEPQTQLELLHAAVALYSTCLPGHNQSPQALYRTLCAEGARTVLLLRDASEIIQEWENTSRAHQQTRTSPDSSDEHDTEAKPVQEINNNPVEEPRRKPWQKILPLKRDYGSSQEDDLALQGEADADDNAEGDPAGEQRATEDVQPDDRVWISWSSRKQLSTSKGDSPDDDDGGTVTGEETSGHGSACSATTTPVGEEPGDGRGPKSGGDPFSDVFSDASESDSNSEMEEEEDADEAFFSRGLGNFLRAVGERRRDRGRALAAWSLAPRHAGPEHRLLACATFAKNYRIPGTKAVFLSLLAVRRKFRKHGIGTFLLKQLKSPAVVGPYDALVVKSSPGTASFFLKNGFTDDIVLNSRFRELDESNQAGNMFCYLPPFDGHYPSFPGTPEWNRPEALAAMEEEVERWKQKSLESYQCQVTCLTRLQHEIFRLHALLKKQENTVQNLRKENCRLQSKLSRAEKKSTRSLIESLEKEAADFERLCSLKLPGLEDRRQRAFP
ncbi:uncharacterized protein LOC8036892 [Ixodes scapularis]|uniref:uncharacterized protein LOC8036892 n=1 Tax=Ixodes scapularis TaxID=6945 RepID=UPI001A9EAC06|nr:uncharacterized protein LOC8036892 [Ixodes scapularis]